MTYNSDLGIFYCIFIPISVIAQKIKIKLARILAGSISFCLKKKKPWKVRMRTSLPQKAFTIFKKNQYLDNNL